MAPIAVDPNALADAGASVAAVGDGLASAMSVSIASFHANTGQDSAGLVFGRQYVTAAGELLKAVSSGIEACRNVGYGVQVTAVNYSRAEAASDVSGRSPVLASPPCPAPTAVPESPHATGTGVAEPLLWCVVEALIGDVWPNGNPAAIRAASAAWRTLAVPLHHVTADMSAAYNAIGAQRMDEAGLIQKPIRDIGTSLSDIAYRCEQLAAGLGAFAGTVENTQHAIRDLLRRLGSIGGLVGTFFEFVSGHGEDELQEIADDVKTVLHHLKSESDAKAQLFEQTKQDVGNWAKSLRSWADREFVELFGDDIGNALATNFNMAVDSGEGGFRWLMSNVEGLSALNPVRLAYDPEGARQTWEGIADFANVLTNPLGAYAADPDKVTGILKGLARTDEWSSDRPLVGLSQNLLDVATLAVPGRAAGTAGAADAAAAGRAARVGMAAEAGATARTVGKLSEIGRSARALGNITRDTAAITEKLDDIVPKPLTTEAVPTGGRPVTAPIPAKTPVEYAVHPHAPSLASHAPRGGEPAAVSSTSDRPAGLGSHPNGPADGLGAGRAMPGPTAPHPGGDRGHLPAGADARTESTADSAGHGGDNGQRPRERPAEFEPGDAHVHPGDVQPLLVRDEPYHTGSILPDYVGEQYPSGPMGSPGVRYLDDVEREAYRITIHDGLLYDAQGNLFDTGNGISAFGPDSNGRAIFVMDEHGNLYASTFQRYHHFHHSSLLGGGDVAAAGELAVLDGEVVLVTDRSGHYMPDRSQTQQFLDQLASQGIVVDMSNIEFYSP